MSLDTPKKELRLPPSTPRKTFGRWQSSAWSCSPRLKPVVANPQATKKALEKCKDHVDTTGAFSTNRTPFAALFLCGRISFVGIREPGSRRSLTLGWVQGFPLKESGWLKGFCVYHPESHLIRLPISKWKFTIGRLTSSISIIKFDADGTPEESDLIRFIWKRLQSSVKVKIEQRKRKHDSWDTLIEKAIDSIQPPSILRYMGQRCPRGNCFTHIVVAKFQALSTWDSWDKPSKKARYKPPHFSHLHFLRSKNGKTSDKKARKEKKRQRRLEYEQAQNDSGSTPTTNVNAPNVTTTARQDLSHITCFNCDKKGHYATKCSKPMKDRDA